MPNANYYIHFLIALEKGHLDSCFPNLEPVDQTEERRQTNENKKPGPRPYCDQTGPFSSSLLSSTSVISRPDQVRMKNTLSWKGPLAEIKWNHNSPLCCFWFLKSSWYTFHVGSTQNVQSRMVTCSSIGLGGQQTALRCDPDSKWSPECGLITSHLSASVSPLMWKGG